MSIFSCDLPATLAFDYPTPTAVSNYIVSQDTQQQHGGISTQSPTVSPDSILPVIISITESILGAQVSSKHDSLMAAGLDSLGAIELRNSLQSKFDIELPATVAFDYPTVNTLTTLISSMLAAHTQPSYDDDDYDTLDWQLQHSSSRLQPMMTTTELVGVSSLYPSPLSAPQQGIELFWRAASLGETVQSQVPYQRWDVDAIYHPDVVLGKSYARLSAFIGTHQGLEDFDNGFFKMSKTEAIAVDPAARILLQISYEALNHAGGVYIDSYISDTVLSTMGTYVGCMFTDYMNVLRVAHGLKHTGAMMTGNGAPYQSGRVAYALGLQGPCNGIDTACSSSLVAAHNAHKGIIAGECGSALVGGINAMLWSGTTVGICQLQALAPDGRCKSFDASADGYGRGEGFVAAFIQKGGSGNANEDSLLAVIRGSAVNQDGRSSSLTAPNGPSQLQLITIALKSAAVLPTNVNMTAIHGTGTPLGDPIELGALCSPLKASSRQAGNPIMLPSVKSCFGHTEGAAGLTGLLFMTAIAHHKQLPPVLSLRSLNPYVASILKSFSSGAAVPREASPAHGLFTPSSLSGTSSFGMSGVNAHMLISNGGNVTRSWDNSSSSTAAVVWESERYWPVPFISSLATFYNSFNKGWVSLVSDLSASNLSFLQDHIVSGRPLFPGTAFLEAASSSVLMALNTNNSMVGISGVTFQSALLHGGKITTKLLQVNLSTNSGKGEIGTTGRMGGDRQHVSFVAAALASQEADIITITEETRSSSLSPLLVSSEKVAPVNTTTSMCSFIEQPSDADAGRFTLHPAPSDASLHLCALPSLQSNSTARIPVTLAFSLCTPSRGSNNHMRQEGSVVEVETGKVHSVSSVMYNGGSLKLNGLVAQAVTGKIQVTRKQGQQQSLYISTWEAASHQTLDVEAEVPLTSSAKVVVGQVKSNHQQTALHEGSGPTHSVSTLLQLLQTSQQLSGISLSQEYGPGLHALAKVAASEKIISSEVNIALYNNQSSRKPQSYDESTSGQFGTFLNQGTLYKQSLVNSAPSIEGQLPSSSISENIPKLRIRTAAVTGGLTGLGALTADWLSNLGVDKVVVLARTRGKTSRGTLGENTTASVLQSCDVSTREDGVHASQHIPDLICHAAGVLQDGMLANQSSQGMRSVYAPKVNGLSNLIDTRRPFSHVIAFSSIAGQLGSAGQGNYAAANSALDSLSGTYIQQGMKVTSVQWGVWSQTGMAASNPRLLDMLRAKGYGSIVPHHGMSLLDVIISTSSKPLFMASDFDWKKFLASDGRRELHYYQSIAAGFEESEKPVVGTIRLLDENKKKKKKPSFSAAAARKSLHSSSLTDIMLTITQLVNDSTGLEIADHSLALVESGIDSISAVDVKNDISTQYNIELPATLVFDYPSVSDIANLVLTKIDFKQQVEEYEEEKEEEEEEEQSLMHHHHQNSMSETEIKSQIQDIVADLLGSSSTDVDVNTPLMEAGFDSIAAVDLRNILMERFDLPHLAATVMFDHPTIAALAQHILQSVPIYNMNAPHDSSAVYTELSLLNVPPPSSSSSSSSSIVGASSSFGNDRDLIDTMTQGYNVQSVIPLSRWDIESTYEPNAGSGQAGALASNCRFASLMPRSTDVVAAFDASFFRLSASEAQYLDPHSKQLLQHTQQAMVQSSHGMVKKSGVYIGCMWATDFVDMLPELGFSDVGSHVSTGNTFPFMAGRISYSFDLQGPCMTTDTACSSSLISIHLAHKGLLNRECKASLAAGANLLLSPKTMAKISALQALSPVGRCKTFDASADGYGRGEGVAVLILAGISSSNALSSSSPIAVIQGSAVNSAGKSSGLTAPSGPGQQQLIAAALIDGNIKSRELGLLSIHGTGTPLGDPIEMGAIGQVLPTIENNMNEAQLTLISSKSCLGHTEGTAGVAGLLAASFCLQIQQRLPIVNLREVNPYVASSFDDWHEGKSVNAAVARSAAPLTGRVGVEVAGTSSFGMSGINAHVLLKSRDDSSSNVKNISIISPVECPWQLQRHFPLPTPNHLLHQVGHVVDKKMATFQCLLSSSRIFFDHQVGDRVLVPATAFIEMSLAAVRSSASVAVLPGVDNKVLTKLTIHAPKVLSGDKRVSDDDTLQCSIDKDGKLVIHSHNGAVHITCHVGSCQVTAVVESLPSYDDATSMTHLKAALLLLLNPRAASIPRHNVATIAPSSKQGDWIWGPEAADAALHLGAVKDGSSSHKQQPASIPVGITTVHTSLSSIIANSYAVAEIPVATRKNEFANDTHGLVNGHRMNIHQLISKSIGQQAVTEEVVDVKHTQLTYAIEWQTSDVVVEHGEIVSGGGGKEKKNSIVLASSNGDSVDQYSVNEGTGEMVVTTALAAMQLNSLLTAINTTHTTHHRSNAAGALFKVAAVESPSFHWSAMQSSQFQAQSEDTTTASLIADADQHGASIVGGAISRPKFIEKHVSGMLDYEVRLDPGDRGSLSSLTAVKMIPLPVNSDDVVLTVKAVGLNFRDVLNVLGMYPGKPGPPGGDCAGVVSAVGSSCQTHKIGDAVFGQAAGCLGTSVVVNQATVVTVPPTLTYEEACTIPTVFLTADAALTAPGGVSKGDQVLIHAASGGLGLAAMQLVAAAGGVPIGTAGTPSKRGFLRHSGDMKAAYSSRTLDYEEELTLSSSQIKVVINSLTSPGMVAASLAVMTLSGSFIEVAKRDIWSAARVAQERPDIHHHTVAVDFMPPQVINEGLTRIAALASQGQVKPVQQLVYPLGDATAAFRQLSTARHVGKIVTAPVRHFNSATNNGFFAISGGLGALGALSARLLAQKGVRHLSLLSRNPFLPDRKHSKSPSSDIRSILHQAMYSWNTEIKVVKMDSALSSDVCGMKDTSLPLPLAGVLHAGGVLQDGLIQNQTLSGVRMVAAPKIYGTERLWNQASTSPIITFKLFSSIAAAIGSGGQANYAAANACLDHTATLLSNQGAPATSINWGAWAGAGMAADAGLDRMKRLGFGALSPDAGMAVVNSVIENRLSGSQAIGAVFHWENFKSTSSLFTEVAYTKEGGENLLAMCNNKDKKNKMDTVAITEESIIEQVLDAAVNVIGSDPDDIGPNMSLVGAGLDSLGAVELRNELGRRLGCELPGTLVFDYPSASSIAGFLKDMLQAVTGNAEEEEQQEVVVSQELVDFNYISIYPDASLSPEHHLAQLARSRPVIVTGITSTLPNSNSKYDGIASTPIDRWNTDLVLDAGYKTMDPSSGRFGGFVDGWDLFDADAFLLSPSEAALLDPQQRFLLEHAASLMTHDGDFDKRVAVSVGIAKLGEPQSIARNTAAAIMAGSSYVGTGKALSAAAGRISFVFGLKGPSIALDTACSSSLVGTHFTRLAMITQDSDAGLSCGVNLPMNWETSSMFAAAGMLAPDGRCKTLDASADGYVRAEGCVVIRLDILLQGGGNMSDFSSVLGIVMLKGSAVNQDGRSSSLTAPHGPSQQMVVSAALQDSGCVGRDLTAVQLHGTGTALGDPIEIGAIAAVAMKGKDIHSAPLSFQSAKSHVGHGETAAGAIGFFRATHHAAKYQSYAIPQLTSLNGYVTSALSLVNRPAYIARQAAGCSKTENVTGISAFAFQGTNVHAIVGRAENLVLNNDAEMKKQLMKEWRRKRVWFEPAAHCLINAATVALGASTGKMSCSVDFNIYVSSAKASYLHQHVVKGRPICPAAAIMEIGLASLTSLLDTSKSGGASPAIIDMVIPSALVLSVNNHMGRTAALRCTASLSSGLTLTSDGALNGLPHFACQLTSVKQVPAVDDAGNETSTALHRLSSLFSKTSSGMPPSPSSSCIGQLDIPYEASRSGHMSYPPAVDSALHLAICNASSNDALKVPAGSHLFSQPYDSTTKIESWALLKKYQLKPDESVVTSFTASQSYVEGMEFRPVGSAESRSRGKAAANIRAKQPASRDSKSHSNMLELYSTSLQVCEPLSTEASLPTRTAAHLISNVANIQIYNNRSSTNCSNNIVEDVMNATQCGLHVLQLPKEFGHLSVCVGNNSNNIAPNLTAIGAALRSMLLSVAAEDQQHLQAVSTTNYVQQQKASSNASNYAVTCSCQGYLKQSTFVPHQASHEFLGNDSKCREVISIDYIISGGLGSLGVLTASWLIQEKNASSIKLLSRTTAASNLKPALLQQWFGRIVVEQCDIGIQSDTYQMAHSSQRVGFIHAGGVLRDGLIASQTLKGLCTTMAPKLNGVQNIQGFLANKATEGVLMFSSLAAMLGNAGQANYAAANATLDAMSNEMSNQGVSCTSLNWGPWATRGMARPEIRARMASIGVGLVEPGAGLLVVSSILSSACPSPNVAPIVITDWAKALHLDSILEEDEEEEEGEKADRNSLFKFNNNNDQQWSRSAIQEEIESMLFSIIARDIDESETLMPAGIDSLATVELRNALSSAFRIELPATITFDHPTKSTLVSFIDGKLQQQGKKNSQKERGNKSRQEPSISVSNIKSSIQTLLEDLLGIAPSSDQQPFMEAGLDSLGAVELRNAIGDSFEFKQKLPATLIFDYPTIEALAQYIATNLFENNNEVADEGSNMMAFSHHQSVGGNWALDTTTSVIGRKTAALVGVSCRYPTQSNNGCHGYVESLQQGDNIQSVVPPSRWDVDAHYHPIGDSRKMYVRFGGWLDGIDLFDREAFRLSQSEVVGMDPQIRMLLENTGDLLMLSSPLEDNTNNVGVYVGCMYTEYLDGVLMPADVAATNSNAIIGHGLSFMVGRLSYTFGLQGPCISTDTACSSSLVALHLAQESLSNGVTNAGIAGGVNMALIPQTTSRICLLQALSPVGRCKTFEASSDGYGRGDALSVALLKNAQQCDASEILVIIASTAVNQDGRSSGLTAPNGPAQTVLIVEVLRQSSGTMSNVEVDMISMHGTGTPLGDPIEVGALNAALPKRRNVALMSSKSCFGHTEGAAGLTGVLLAVASLNNNIAMPVVNLRNINPYAGAALNDWNSSSSIGSGHNSSTSAVSVYREKAPRNNNAAGTSSFGMSGVNAHALLLRDGGGGGEMSPADTKNCLSLSTLAWSRASCWPCPLSHPFMMSMKTRLPRKSKVVMTVNLSTPSCSWLTDHALQGRPLLAGAAMFELMFGAISHLMTMNIADSTIVAVNRIAIQAPVVLNIDGKSATLLSCVVEDGKVVIASSDFKQQHISGVVAMMPKNTFRSRVETTVNEKRMSEEVLKWKILLPLIHNSNEGYSIAHLSKGSMSNNAFKVLSPAVLDASIHLAPVPILPEESIQVMRVPVSLSVITSNLASDNTSNNNGGGWSSVKPVSTNGTEAINNISWMQENLPGNSIWLDGLSAKPMTNDRGKRSDAREAAVVSRPSDLLYQLQLQAYDKTAAVAVSDANQASTSSSSALEATITLAEAPPVYLHRASYQAPTIAAALQVAQHVQTAKAATAHLSANATSVSTSSSSTSDMLKGLFRVAALDIPDVEWSTSTSDDITLSSLNRSIDSPPIKDVFGPVSLHSVEYVPLLLPQAYKNERENGPFVVCDASETVVTGGLGALGSLVAQYQVLLRSAMMPTTLVGRSPHQVDAQLKRMLKSSSNTSLFKITMADPSLIEDVAVVIGGIEARSVTLMHAAGVVKVRRCI